jgi:hypothetical protein
VEIFEGIEIIEPYPALYLLQDESVVICDLHLGYEEALAEEGITLPTSQLSQIKEDFLSIVERKKPSTLIINGDLRHTFSKSTPQEWKEIPLFLEFALQHVKKIILVRGNHDTMLGPLKKFPVEVVREYEYRNLIFLHGDKERRGDERTMVIGHEHPFILLGDKVGARVRIPAFLIGEKLIVMPAFTPLAGGTAVNLTDEFLSPMLKKEKIRRMKAIGIDKDAGLLRFPEIGKWEAFSLRL